ncbi:hypothetical protein MTR67_021284 [Solanum verrucosum]|uniref:Uncharacterized protein n=1 Tax=Solanum verrucosum TaxID=315347 RepID=A0AAF0QPT7_SOLVR|nr:hypothetical protein MTR67_021284 [Solanum verrucosum]
MLVKSKSEWPPALCDQKRSCCYPTTGKPTLDFGQITTMAPIHQVVITQTSMMKQSPASNYSIKSQNKHVAGTEPGGFYSLEVIKEAVKNGTGHEAAIECNKDALGNN